MSDKQSIPRIPVKPSWKLRPEVLLCANTVKPMHGVVPRLILGREWWDRTRQDAYASTHYHCVACGVYKGNALEHQWLEGHEIYETYYQAGRMIYKETVPLCHYCHNFIHDGRLKNLYIGGEVTAQKVADVMAHGYCVLQKAGLVKLPNAEPIAEWEKWRLELYGKLYPPIYKNMTEWYKAFSPDHED